MSAQIPPNSLLKNPPTPSLEFEKQVHHYFDSTHTQFQTAHERTDFACKLLAYHPNYPFKNNVDAILSDLFKHLFQTTPPQTPGTQGLTALHQLLDSIPPQYIAEILDYFPQLQPAAFVYFLNHEFSEPTAHLFLNMGADPTFLIAGRPLTTWAKQYKKSELCAFLQNHKTHAIGPCQPLSPPFKDNISLRNLIQNTATDLDNTQDLKQKTLCFLTKGNPLGAFMVMHTSQTREHLYAQWNASDTQILIQHGGNAFVKYFLQNCPTHLRLELIFSPENPSSIVSALRTHPSLPLLHLLCQSANSEEVQALASLQTLPALLSAFFNSPQTCQQYPKILETLGTHPILRQTLSRDLENHPNQTLPIQKLLEILEHFPFKALSFCLEELHTSLQQSIEIPFHLLFRPFYSLDTPQHHAILGDILQGYGDFLFTLIDSNLFIPNHVQIQIAHQFPDTEYGTHFQKILSFFPTVCAKELHFFSQYIEQNQMQSPLLHTLIPQHIHLAIHGTIAPIDTSLRILSHQDIQNNAATLEETSQNHIHEQLYVLNGASYGLCAGIKKSHALLQNAKDEATQNVIKHIVTEFIQSVPLIGIYHLTKNHARELHFSYLTPQQQKMVFLTLAKKHIPHFLKKYEYQNITSFILEKLDDDQIEKNLDVLFKSHLLLNTQKKPEEWTEEEKQKIQSVHFYQQYLNYITPHLEKRVANNPHLAQLVATKHKQQHTLLQQNLHQLTQIFDHTHDTNLDDLTYLPLEERYILIHEKKYNVSTVQKLLQKTEVGSIYLICPHTRQKVTSFTYNQNPEKTYPLSQITK